MKKILIPVEVSARHIHLSQTDLDKLFGKGYELKELKDLSQASDFAAMESVEVKTPKSQKFSLRIVGPARKESQVELSMTDCIKMGINAPVRLSGDLEGVKSYFEAQGPRGKAKVKVIVAKRHLHLSFEQAKKLGLRKGQKVKVQIIGQRGLVFENVIVRSGRDYALACHIDTDEANACGFGKICGQGYLLI